jgi:paraquat-inducible protein B
MTESDFPVAKVTASKRFWWSSLSKMWLATLACLLLAISLIWHSLESPGPEIVIRFSEGYGLKPGDGLRHRGIDIGRVESVQLNQQLDRIEVLVVLDVSAAAIACEGSRFWVVRPELGLTGVSGLETAVGAKYLGVIPGNSNIEQTEFEGLGRRPPEGLGQSGIEIVLRGDDRYGVNPGSPLTWRGIEIGQVLSSSLSADALHVDTRVLVLDAYRRLVSRNSKFWVTSGIHMGLDVTGFEFDTESFATIARGGIAFITPGPVAANDEVQPGDVFTLHEKRDDAWIEAATALNLMELEPPPLAMLVASWKQKHFGISRSHETRASALTVATGDGATVLVPVDLATPPSEALEGSYQLQYTWGEQTSELGTSPKMDSALAIAVVPLASDQVNPASLLSRDRIRTPEGPEDCFAVRKSWRSDTDSAVMIEMIGKHELSVDGDFWRTTNTKLSRDLWHGAAVIASGDEKVIGMLVVLKDGPIVAPLP